MQDNSEENFALRTLKKSYQQRKLHSVGARKKHLLKLRRGLVEMKKEMEDALYQDLYRCTYFTNLSETGACLFFLDHHLKNIDNYAKEVHSDPYLIFAPAQAKIRYEPLGVALIIGSWNYPYFNLIKPLITCITAGNCAVIKPSEFGTASSKVLQKLFDNYMDPECFRVILGETEVAQKLNDLPFDIICFTGSTRVGKIVA